MNYISPFRYTLEGMAINELYGETFTCEDSSLPPATLSQECYNTRTVRRILEFS